MLLILFTTTFSFWASGLTWLEVICTLAPDEMLLTGLNVLTLGVEDEMLKWELGTTDGITVFVGLLDLKLVVVVCWI